MADTVPVPYAEKREELVLFTALGECLLLFEDILLDQACIFPHTCLEKRSLTISTEPLRDLSLSKAQRFGQLCRQFEKDWQSRDRPRLEDYLASLPSEERSELLKELLCLELELRRQANDTPRLEEYLDRFPANTELVSKVWRGEDRYQSSETVDPGAAGAHMAAGDVDAKPSPRMPLSETFPTHAGKYQLLDEIARGGMGAVLRASDPDFDRTLAVKMMLGRRQDRPDLEDRFLVEAKITGQLQHPGIPPAHELGRLEDGRPYFAMKLIEGKTLAALLVQYRNNTEEMPRLLSIFEQICQTIAYAHNRGVLHRDLKPANIMVGSFGEVQVMDWGLAKLVKDQTEKSHASERNERTAEADSVSFVIETDKPSAQTTEWQSADHFSSSDASSRTRAGAVLGTPAYMAPEQARGETEQIDERSDVFGLGAILCAILTGQPPFTGDNAIEVVKLAGAGELTDAVQRLQRCGADEELIALTLNCLAASKDDRPADAGAVAQAVSTYQDRLQQRLRQAEIERAQSTTKILEESKRRRVWLGLAAALLALIVLGSGTVLWVQNQFERDRLEQVQRENEKQQLQIREANRLARLRDDHNGSIEQIRDLIGRYHLVDAEKELVQAEKRLGPRDPQDLKTELKRWRKGWTRVDRLDRIRQQKATYVEGKHNNREFAVRAYRRAFEELGLGDPERDPASVVAKRIRASITPNHLVAAVEDWAGATRNNKLRDWLLAITRQADPDEYRKRFRDAELWQDTAKLKHLVAKLDVARLSPALLITLTAWLPEGSAERITLLRRACTHHRRDYWLNSALARELVESHREESMGYWRVALTLRPGNASSYNNLGVSYAAMGMFDEAVQHYKTAIGLDPKYALAYYNFGIFYYHRKKLDKAIELFKKAIRFGPDFASAYRNLGAAYHAKGETDKAIEQFTLANKLDSGHPKAHSSLGVAYLAKGELDKALEMCKLAVQLDPSDASIHFNLGVVYYTRKELDKAIAQYEKVVKLNSKDADAHRNLAYAYHDKKELDKAIKHYQLVLKLKPKNVRTLLHLGEAYTQKNDLVTAIKQYKLFIKHKPKSAEAHSKLGVAYSANGELDKAIAQYKLAVKFDPKHVPAHIDLGLAYRKKRLLHKAIEHYNLAIKLDPKSAVARSNLGAAYAAKGELDKAVEQFNLAISIDPDHAMGHYNLGVAYDRRGETDKAIAQYKLAIKLDFKYVPLYVSLGMAYRNKHELDKAIEQFKQAIKLAPKNAEAHNHLGVVYAFKGELERAVAQYKLAIKFDPKYAEARVHLGLAYRQKQELDKAIEQYKLAIQLDPNLVEAYTNLGAVYKAKGEVEKAITSYRLAVKINPKNVTTQYNLGLAYFTVGQMEKAAGHFNLAIKLDPNLAEAHCNLGHALRQLGNFADALKSLKRGHQLGLRRGPRWRYPSAQWVQKCDLLLKLDQKLKDEKTPQNTQEMLAFANLCQRYKKCYLQATKFYQQAFAADANLAKNLQSQYRYNAACAAALASAGQGEDAKNLTGKKRAALRKQALGWLTADLAAYANEAKKPRSHKAIAQRLTHWQKDPDLYRLRDPANWAKLPKDEQKQWQKLWSNVDNLRKRTRGKQESSITRVPHCSPLTAN